VPVVQVVALVVVPQAAELVPARAAVLLVARPVAAQLQAVAQPLVLAELLQVRVVLQPVAQLLRVVLPQPVVQRPLVLVPLQQQERQLRQQPQQRLVWWLPAWPLRLSWRLRLPRKTMRLLLLPLVLLEPPRPRPAPNNTTSLC